VLRTWRSSRAAVAQFYTPRGRKGDVHVAEPPARNELAPRRSRRAITETSAPASV
jgi:hypothetical protein